jgi:hypothetical protein
MAATWQFRSGPRNPLDLAAPAVSDFLDHPPTLREPEEHRVTPSHERDRRAKLPAIDDPRAGSQFPEGHPAAGAVSRDPTAQAGIPELQGAELKRLAIQCKGSADVAARPADRRKSDHDTSAGVGGRDYGKTMAIEKPAGEKHPGIGSEIHRAAPNSGVRPVPVRLKDEAILGESIGWSACHRPHGLAGRSGRLPLSDRAIGSGPAQIGLGPEPEITLANGLFGDGEGLFGLVEKTGDHIPVAGAHAAAGTSRSDFDGSQLNDAVLEDEPLFLSLAGGELGPGREPGGVANPQDSELEPAGPRQAEAKASSWARKGAPHFRSRAVEQDDQGAGHGRSIGRCLDPAAPLLGPERPG